MLYRKLDLMVGQKLRWSRADILCAFRGLPFQLLILKNDTPVSLTIVKRSDRCWFLYGLSGF